MDQIGKLIRNPLIVLDAGGKVLQANSRAKRAFGERIAHWSDVFASPEQLDGLLERASGSSEPVPGSLELRAHQTLRRRCPVEAVALRGAAPAAYAIEIRGTEDDQFTALTERVRELNAEIGVRRKTQAQLEEALAHNGLLFRELQHRVKNHLQMVLTLVTVAGRESADAGQLALVRGLQSKLSALVDAQRLFSAEQAAGGVRANELLSSIAKTVKSLANACSCIDVRAADILLPNDIASPVALVANELLTNAVKHAGSDAALAILVSLERDGTEALLEVRDSGPGFVDPLPPARPQSGLGLVRGLCRQIGGRLDVRAEQDGTVATVRFPLPDTAHVAS